ncbi:hypothetical protein FACS1894102_6480 [Spirochaetia bacterium]|nr:hypothetical protein FACS1894102_6480 [Spirochaetia bacterium]
MRIEVIANHSVEENIFDEFKAEGVCKHYTKLNNQHGVGTSGPRMGDAVWPEENFILTVWCEEEEALGIERALKRVKARFPAEGIKMFGLHEFGSNTALLSGVAPTLIEYNPALGSNGSADTGMIAENGGTASDSQPRAKLHDGLGLKV